MMGGSVSLWSLSELYIDENLGIRILQKMCVNYETKKIIAARLHNSNIETKFIYFFFVLIGVTWYYHAIYITLTYFASFTSYKDEIFEVSSNLHIQRCKFGEKIYKFGEIFFFLIYFMWSLLSLFVPSLRIHRGQKSPVGAKK